MCKQCREIGRRNRARFEGLLTRLQAALLKLGYRWKIDRALTRKNGLYPLFARIVDPLNNKFGCTLSVTQDGLFRVETILAGPIRTFPDEQIEEAARYCVPFAGSLDPSVGSLTPYILKPFSHVR